MFITKQLKIKRNRYLFLVLFLIGFVQCELIYELGNETFNPEDHPLIQEGDTLIFVADNTNDTLFVKESKVYEPHEYDDAQNYKYYASDLLQIGCTDTCINLRISISPEGFNLTYYYPIREINDTKVNIETLERKKAKYTIEVGDYHLENLYRIDFVYSAKPNLYVEISSVLFSKTYGYVQYECVNGEEYVISEECLKMLMEREK